MRRLVAALVVVALSVSLAGCGGGGEDQADQNATAGDAAPAGNSAPPPPPAAGDAAAPVVDRSPLEEVSFESVPAGGASSVATGLPDAIVERLEAGQPMLLFFFDREQKTSDDQREEIDDVLEEYRGTIDLLAYDVSQDLADGKHDEADAEAVSLARGLEVGFTPYIVLVDEQGLMVWRHRGYVDRDLIEREVLRATD